jgi:hypothetical protein
MGFSVYYETVSADSRDFGRSAWLSPTASAPLPDHESAFTGAYDTKRVLLAHAV